MAGGAADAKAAVPGAAVGRANDRQPLHLCRRRYGRAAVGTVGVAANQKPARRQRGLRAGQLFAVYLALYGVERFLIEFVRAKSDRFVLGLSTSQIASISLLLIAAFLWWRQSRKAAPAPLANAGAPAKTKRDSRVARASG